MTTRCIEPGCERPRLPGEQICGAHTEGVTKCRHCRRFIVFDPTDGWIDPEATGDDVVWRETCDSHDTFEARHEPTKATMIPEPEREHATIWVDYTDGTSARYSCSNKTADYIVSKLAELERDESKAELGYYVSLDTVTG